MAAKPRINLRFRGDLWDLINRRAKRLETSATAELEAAAERYLIEQGEMAAVAAPANGRVQASAAVKAGVKPIPKPTGGKRR